VPPHFNRVLPPSLTHFPEKFFNRRSSFEKHPGPSHDPQTSVAGSGLVVIDIDLKNGDITKTKKEVIRGI
jgi:hypothetical protein